MMMNTSLMAVTSQGVQMDEGVLEDNDPCMVVLHAMLEEATEAKEIILPEEMALIQF
jgi:hypothetical protein